MSRRYRQVPLPKTRRPVGAPKKADKDPAPEVVTKSKEQEVSDTMFDTIEVDPGEEQDDHGDEFHVSALGDISSDEVLDLWKVRGLHYRERFLAIIIDVLASVNALSDIQAHFKKESIDPEADYVTDSLLTDFEWVVGDKLVHELISNLFEDDPDAGKRAHAYILAIKSSRRPVMPLRGLKSLIDGSVPDTGESPFGNVATRRSYSNDRPR